MHEFEIEMSREPRELSVDLPGDIVFGVPGPVGPIGPQGITPTIGDNGNWYIGDTDTGKPSRGADGLPGENYVLTDADKDEIAEQAAVLVKIPDDVGSATIMWENPNPTTRVDVGNGLPVAIDFSGYKTAQLICRMSVNEDSTFSAWLDPTKRGFVVPFNWTKFDDNTRQVVIFSGTMEAWMDEGSLVFWGASIQEISMVPYGAPQVVNKFSGDYMIPQMIIGYP